MSAVSLRPMSQADFDTYCGWAISEFAREVSRSRGLPAEEGLAEARKSFAALFPGGNVGSADQSLFFVEAGGETVGTLHFGIRRDRPKPYLYVWDIHIDAEHRGKGYGEATFRLVEKLGKEMGLTELKLHVFGHNTVARALYQKLGFMPESIVLGKNL